MQPSIRSEPVAAALGVLLTAWAVVPAAGQAAAAVAGAGWEREAPALDALVAFDRSSSDLRVAVVRYEEDRDALLRRHDVKYSPV